MRALAALLPLLPALGTRDADERGKFNQQAAEASGTADDMDFLRKENWDLSNYSGDATTPEKILELLQQQAKVALVVSNPQDAADPLQTLAHPLLDPLNQVVQSATLPDLLGNLLGPKVDAGNQHWIELIAEQLKADNDILMAVCGDIAKAVQEDPAVVNLLQPVLFFKGFHALTLQRVAHSLWVKNDQALTLRSVALLLQSRVSELFAVDIHPGAKFGRGVMLDHATGVVIGATSEVGNDIYILHEVTLGSNGKTVAGGDRRHPILEDGVKVGAGSKIIGPITVHKNAKVGASAVVLADVPTGETAVGLYKPKKK